MDMEFKDRISSLRTEKGLSITKFAAIFDKSEAAIRSWEAGRTKPEADTLISLSRYFNVSTDYLLGLDTIRNSYEKSVADGKLIEIGIYLERLNPEQLEIAKDLMRALAHSLVLFNGEKYTQDSFIEYLKSFGALFDLSRKFAVVTERLDKNTSDAVYKEKVIDDYLFIYSAIEEILGKLSKFRQSVFKDIESYKERGYPDETVGMLLEYIAEQYSGKDKPKYSALKLFLENIRNEILKAL